MGNFSDLLIFTVPSTSAVEKNIIEIPPVLWSCILGVISGVALCVWLSYRCWCYLLKREPIFVLWNVPNYLPAYMVASIGESVQNYSTCQICYLLRPT